MFNSFVEQKNPWNVHTTHAHSLGTPVKFCVESSLRTSSERNLYHSFGAIFCFGYELALGAATAMASFVITFCLYPTKSVWSEWRKSLNFYDSSNIPAQSFFLLPHTRTYTHLFHHRHVISRFHSCWVQIEKIKSISCDSNVSASLWSKIDSQNSCNQFKFVAAHYERIGNTK